MQYKHLTPGERYQISASLAAGHSVREAASIIGRPPSTVLRELRRNSGRKGYRPVEADGLAARRRSRASSRRRITPSQWNIVEALVRQEWSPEQISERCRLEGTIQVSPEWIYHAIYVDKRYEGDAWRHLRSQKTRRKRYGTNSRRGPIPGRVGIHRRPAGANNRSRSGHWEADTMHGGLAGVVTMVERKSRYTRIAKVPRRTSDAVRKAIACRLNSLGRRVRSVTVDNGSEFADHAGISEDLGAQVYFADPYASWQRGTNENTNGLLRQYFPKGSNMDKLTCAQITKAEDRLNHRPRKCLGYRTPHEVLYGVRHKHTVALRS